VRPCFEDCGEVLSINWFEEKETKKFMGAGVVEFESSEAAKRAVAAGLYKLNRS
jgi:nucleolin